jgi:hypothetical protein
MEPQELLEQQEQTEPQARQAFKVMSELLELLESKVILEPLAQVDHREAQLAQEQMQFSF